MLRRLLPPVLLAAYLFLCLFVWVSDRWRPEWDSAMYIRTAVSLASGEGYVYAGEPFFLRPPALPWIISRMSADPARDARPLNRMIMLFAGLAVGAAYFAFKPDLGRWLALAAAILAGTSPLFVSRFNWVHSEFPFLTFLLLGLGLARRASEPGKRRSALALGAGAFLSIAFYFRTIAILLVFGFALLGFRPGGRGRHRILWVGAAVLLLLAIPWFQYASKAKSRASVPPDQMLLLDYGTALLRVDPGDPASPLVPLRSWRDRLVSNGKALFTDVGDAVFEGGGTVWRGVAVGAVLLGLVSALRTGPTILEWFTVTYALVLVTYFAYATRLVTPLVPFVYFYAFRFLGSLCDRTARYVACRRFAGLVLASVAAVLFSLNGTRFGYRLETPRIMEAGREVNLAPMWEDTYAAAEWIRAHTSPDAVLLCFGAPVLEVLTGRTAYTYRFPRGRDLLAKYDPDFVLFDVPHPAAIEFERLVAARALERWVLPRRSTRGEIRIYRMPGA